MISTRDAGGTRILTVEDRRIDAAGAVDFKAAAHAALDGWDGDVVMDLGGVDFVDSSGLGALVAVSKMVPGRRLGLAGCGAPVTKVLTLTRMDRVFDLFPDAEAALAARAAA